jgi:hypothetical protein
MAGGEGAAAARGADLSVGRQSRWTHQQDTLLRKIWPYAEMRTIAQVMLRTPSAIKNRVHHLGLKRNLFRKPYSAHQVRMLLKLFPHMSSFNVAKRIKRTVSSVNRMAYKLGVHKTQKYLASPDACRLRRGGYVGKAHRFLSGHVPANKGLRRPGYSLTHGRMAQTTFKKGQRPHTWLPVGTVKPNANGYLRRKITDFPNNGRGANDKNWEFVHRRVWEDAHGPIPKGHRIWWKDKNHENCALENLELLSDEEHMARTTIHRLPTELRNTIMLAGRLKRIIREKKQREGGLDAEQHHRAAEASV